MVERKRKKAESLDSSPSFCFKLSCVTSAQILLVEADHKVSMMLLV